MKQNLKRIKYHTEKMEKLKAQKEEINKRIHKSQKILFEESNKNNALSTGDAEWNQKVIKYLLKKKRQKNYKY